MTVRLSSMSSPPNSYEGDRQYGSRRLMENGDLVRLRGMPKTEWHAPTRTWRTLDGMLGRVRRRYGTAFPGLVVDLLRRHRGTGKALRPRTVHITPDQALPAEPLAAEEERLVAESVPLLAEAQRERDHNEVGGALWRQSWESTGEAMSDARRRLVDEVEQALTEGAKGKPETLQAISRWFAANRSLLTLAAQHLLAKAERAQSAMQDSGPSEQSLEPVTPFGDEAFLNAEGEFDSAEVLDELGELGRWDNEILLRLRRIEEWDFESHFDARGVSLPPFDDLYDPFAALGPASAETEYTRAVGNVALLICPSRVLLARAGRRLLGLLGSVAPHLEHARRAANWDYRQPMMAAVYDVIQVVYGERQPPLRGHLIALPRASLGHQPTAVLLFALCYYLMTDESTPGGIQANGLWRIAKFVGDRADYNPPSQASLPGFKVDTADSVLWEAIRVTMPRVAERLVSELGNDIEGLGTDEP